MAVHNTVAVMWNKKLNIPYFQYGNLQNAIINHWNNFLDERTFPLPFWKIKRWITQGATEIALVISNINKINDLDGEWIVFNNNVQIDPNLEYFVLDLKYFNDEIVYQDASNTVKGMRRTTPHYKLVLNGHIVKINPQQVSMIAVVGEITERANPGPGGIGATSGAKIPSQP